MSCSESGGSERKVGVSLLVGALERDGDGVVLDGGGGGNVEHGLDADGIAEINLAVLQLELLAIEGGGALGDGDAAEDGGLGERAADGQVDVAGKAREGVLEIKRGRGGDADVERDFVGGRIGIGRQGDAPPLPASEAKSTSGLTAKPVSMTRPLTSVLAWLPCTRIFALAVEVTAFRIADADVFRVGVEISVEAAMIGDEAADLDQAAAAVRGDVFKVEAVLIEDQLAVHAAEAVDVVLERDVDVGELHVAGEVRIFHGAFGVHAEVDVAGGDDVGVEGLRQGHIDGAFGAAVDGPRLIEDADGAFADEVGIGTDDVQRIHGEGAVAQRRVHSAVAVDGHVFERDRQLAQAHVAIELLWLRSGPETVTAPAMEELPRMPVTLKVRSSGSMLNSAMFRVAWVW